MTDDRSKRKTLIWMMLGTFLVSLFLYGIYAWIVHASSEGGLGNESAAQFGDAFGAITGFVTACALGITAISLYFQREELRATFKEMRQSREAQEEQAAAAKESTEVQRRYTEELSKLNELLAEIGAMYQIRNSFDALRTDLENEVREWQEEEAEHRSNERRESHLTRKAEIVKAMSRLASLVPLHGDILDRIDAMQEASVEAELINEDESEETH